MLISPSIAELLALHEAIAKTEADAESPAGERSPPDASAGARAALASVSFCREQLRRPAGELNPPPLLTGHDLIRHGVPRGKVYQALLERVRDAQLEARATTTAAALALVDELLAAGPVAPSPHTWRHGT
jgi:hypothetical protein